MKNIFYIQFGRHNPVSTVEKCIDTLFQQEDIVHFDEYSILVHTSKKHREISRYIGIDLVDDIDGFMVIPMNMTSLTTTFTDRHDIIEFIKRIKHLGREKTRTMTVDDILDKISAHGKDSLTSQEMDVLDRAGSS